MVVLVIGMMGITSIVKTAIKASTDQRRLKLEEETKKFQYQKELLELEIRKEETYIKRLQEESKKYDRIIEQ
jgi:uncharacterized protein YlxW (UPF0749 family)